VHTGIFGMITGSQLLFGFGQVKRSSVVRSIFYPCQKACFYTYICIGLHICMCGLMRMYVESPI
jgi:hypothetical protein